MPQVLQTATCKNCGRPITKPYAVSNAEWRHDDDRRLCTIIKFAEPQE
jgi:hypothetical protein